MKTLACVTLLLELGLLPFILAEPMDIHSSEEGSMCDTVWNTIVQSQQQMLDQIKDAIQDCAANRTSIPPCVPMHGQVQHTFRDCANWYKAGYNQSGVYNVFVYIAGSPLAVPVYCDMETDGGGWLVFQRRQDGSVDFLRNWTDYSNGFGDITGEFWLGNDFLHLFSGQEPQRLRVDLNDNAGHSVYAEYDHFYVGPPTSDYVLNISSYSGNAGDSLVYHDSKRFSTKDRDNDESSGTHCAVLCQGAWWYNSCRTSNLNGPWTQAGKHTSNIDDSLAWITWKYSIPSTEMKMRPFSF